MKGETTMIDIYEAAGATVSEDRKTVTLKPGQMKPFEIVLRVFPDAVESFGSGRPDEISFGVMLHDEVEFGEHIPYQGTPYRNIHYDAVVKLPVSQVVIHKKEECND